MERQSDHRTYLGSFEHGQPAALKGGVDIALAGAVDAAWRSMPCAADAAGPDALIEGLKKDNARFLSGSDHKHDYLTRKQARGSGRFPAAVFLSCIDSSATTAELIPDSGIGDTFNAGIAGDIANEDLSGSQAAQQQPAGQPARPACEIKPAIDALQHERTRIGSNIEFTEKVASVNARTRSTTDAIAVTFCGLTGNREI